MSQHIWKENAIGEGYKCHKCKMVIFLPPGVSPNDYTQDICKALNDNVYRSNPEEKGVSNGKATVNSQDVLLLQDRDGLHTGDVVKPNRHQLRRGVSIQRNLHATEKY